MWGCLFVLLIVGLVGKLLVSPITVTDLMAAQTPPQQAGPEVWAASVGLAAATAVVMALTAGRRRAGRWWVVLARAAALLAVSTAVALWVRHAVGTDDWTRGATLESLAAGITAFAFRVAVRRSERGRPLPGEVWLALVPFRERDECARHYCVVLSRRWGYAEVLQITSQNKDGRSGFVWLPNADWDRVSGKGHWVEVGLPPRRVPYRNFLKDRPQGPCPPAVWRELRRRRPD
ncbi:hypothetical protein [Streptomyces sp. CC228A]|uniref:hypothetical protein n=1 Tax=Streptomyces sp. CC228A TaxID=2898186 RepID=UPI001F31874F|nr:hypothetical protein [Streptomyces sp. CC228A]